MDRENKCTLIYRVDLLNPKFQVSSHLLWLNSPICVRPGLKTCRQFCELHVRVFIYSYMYQLKHNVLQLSSKFVFIIFNENENQQHFEISFIHAFFLYNFFQTFLQYKYLFWWQHTCAHFPKKLVHYRAFS